MITIDLCTYILTRVLNSTSDAGVEFKTQYFFLIKFVYFTSCKKNWDRISNSVPA
jgi:hypothetical protein